MANNKVSHPNKIRRVNSRTPHGIVPIAETSEVAATYNTNQSNSRSKLSEEIVAQIFCNSPEACCWFGTGTKNTEETTTSRIRQLKTVYMTLHGCKTLVSNNDQSDTCTNN